MATIASFLLSALANFSLGLLLAHLLGPEQFGVYSVAVGTKVGISIQQNGKPLMDKNDKLVISKLDENFLRGVANSACGFYYELNNSKNDVQKLISDINQAEGALVDSRTITVVSNKYYYFLGAALVLILLDVLITIGTFRL